MRLLLLADVHAGAALAEWGDRSDARRREIDAALKDAVDEALNPKEGAHAVLIAGDLFDRPDPSEETVGFAWEQLGRLGKAGIPVVIVPGYFDSLGPGSVYTRDDIPPSITVVDWAELRRVEVTTAAGPLQVYSFTWIPGLTPENPWAGFVRDQEVAGPHVGLFHADLRVEGDPAASTPAPALDSKTLETCGVDLVHLGRAHEYGEFEIGDTNAVYPGTPVGLGYGEWGDRFLVTAEFTKRGLKIRTRVRSSSPVLSEDIHLTAGLTEPDVAALIRTRCEEAAMVRVHLRGEVAHSLDPAAIIAALGPGAPVVDLVDETDLVLTPPGGGDEAIRVLFEQRMQSRINEADDPEERDVIRRALRIGVEYFWSQETGHAR